MRIRKLLNVSGIKIGIRFYIMIWSISFTHSLYGQEIWSKDDSLKLKKILEKNEDIQINPSAKEELNRMFGISPAKVVPPALLFPIEDLMSNFITPISEAPYSYRNSLQYYYRDSPLRKYRFLKKYRIGMDYSLLMNPNSRVLIQQNINFQYMITDKFGCHIFGGYSIDKSKSPILPSTANPAYIGTGVYYNITDKVQIKTNVNYQLNIIKKRWEWTWDLGVGAKF